jgi:hypothetical protein
MDLHDLWSWAYALRTNGIWHSDLEKEQAEKLENAIEMLNHVIMGYQGSTDIPRVINSLPREAKEIPNDTIIINERKIT